MGCGASNPEQPIKKDEPRKKEENEQKNKEEQQKKKDKPKKKDEKKQKSEKEQKSENKIAVLNKVQPKNDEKQIQKDYKQNIKKKQKAQLESATIAPNQDFYANLDKIDQSIADAIREAIDNEKYDEFVKIFEENSELYPNFLLNSEWLCIHYICLQQEYQMLDYALKKAYQRCNKDNEKFKNLLNSKQPGTNETPLMVASKSNSPNCVLILLKIGGLDTKLKNYEKETAFQVLFLLFQFFQKMTNLKKNHPSYKLLKKASKETDLDADYLETPPIKDIKELGHEIKESEKFQWKDDKILQVPYQIDKSETKYQELIEKHAKENTNFIDPEFPHDVKSLSAEEGEQQSFKNVVWLRPQEIFKKEKNQIKLFDNIEPNDIKQGPLAVCYLLATLSGLAEFPERVVRLFNIREYNTQGVYSVTFYKLGRPYEIIIDDYFPCNASTRQLMFAQPNGAELWGILLEKAWAKLFGNYMVSETMSVSESMQQILGCPSQYFAVDSKEPKELQKILQKYDDKKYVINATTFPEGNKEMGIVGMHAYSIISVYSLDNLFLMKLRNPWGNFEWKNGLYSDDSTNWTQDLIKKVDFKNEDDGIFFMTFEEFAKEFRFISIAFYLDDYKLLTKPVTTHQENTPYCWEFTIEKEQDVGLRVHQLYERYFAEEENYEYQPTEVFLFDSDYKFLEVGTVAGCAFGSHAVPFAEEAMIKLKPGKYYLTTKVMFSNTSKPNHYTLSAYAGKDATLTEITKPNFYKELLEKAIISTFRKNPDAWELLWNCFSYQKFVGRSLLAIYLINKNEKPLKVNFAFDQMNNVAIPAEFKETDDFFSVTLQPEEERGIYMITPDYVAARSYTWKRINLEYV